MKVYVNIRKFLPNDPHTRYSTAKLIILVTKKCTVKVVLHQQKL